MVIFGSSLTRAFFPFLPPLTLCFLPLGGMRLSIGFLHFSGPSALKPRCYTKLAEPEGFGIAQERLTGPGARATELIEFPPFWRIGPLTRHHLRHGPHPGWAHEASIFRLRLSHYDHRSHCAS